MRKIWRGDRSGDRVRRSTPASSSSFLFSARAHAEPVASASFRSDTGSARVMKKGQPSREKRLAFFLSTPLLARQRPPKHFWLQLQTKRMPIASGGKATRAFSE